MIESAPTNILDKQDQVAREEFLLEFLRLLEPRKSGQRGAHVALSRLSPLSRRQSHLRLASEGLTNLAKTGRGHLFQLANDDLMFFCDASAEPEVKSELSRLRALFADDPIMRDIEDAASFGRIYDLAHEFSAVVKLVRGLDTHPERTTAFSTTAADSGIKERLKRREQQGRPVPPDLLPKLDAALARADVSSFIRRHPVCRLLPDTPPEYVLTDLSISLPALSEAVVPTFDLEADRFIARYLLETLDRRILTMLLRQEPNAQRGNIAIPLSLSTLTSEKFRYFDDQISMMRRGSIVLKIALPDIFGHLDAARLIFRLARHRGYRTLLSGVTPLAFSLVNFQGLGIDFVRCECNPTLFRDPEAAERLAKVSQGLAPTRLVLAGVDSHDTLVLGLGAGIELFQGRYLEQAVRDAKWRRRLSMVLGRGEEALSP